jgi:shikimate kinase
MSDGRAAARHLVLVGLMGAGKTTVGAVCAARLGRPFVDTDDLVEASTGLTVAEVFATQGEARFRDLECQAVIDACEAPEPAVIACGGGAVVDAGNRRRLRRAGFVVWLQAPPATLRARVDAGAARPLLSSGGTGTLERLAVVRAAAYEAVADAFVDTDARTIDQVVDAVLEVYEP